MTTQDNPNRGRLEIESYSSMQILPTPCSRFVILRRPVQLHEAASGRAGRREFSVHPHGRSGCLCSDSLLLLLLHGIGRKLGSRPSSRDWQDANTSHTTLDVRCKSRYTQLRVEPQVRSGSPCRSVARQKVSNSADVCGIRQDF